MKVVYVDIDDTLADYSSAHHNALLKNPEIAYPQSQYGFYAKLNLIPGSKETLLFMADNPDQFDVWILTAPSTRNVLSYSEKRVWVEERLGDKWIDRLIISPNKGLLKGDILIDNETSGRGQELFEGELIHFGSSLYPDWESIRRYLNVR